MIGLVSATILACFLNFVVMIAWLPFYTANTVLNTYRDALLCSVPCAASSKACELNAAHCELAYLRKAAMESYAGPLLDMMRYSLVFFCFYVWLFCTIGWCKDRIVLFITKMKSE